MILDKEQKELRELIWIELRYRNPNEKIIKGLCRRCNLGGDFLKKTIQYFTPNLNEVDRATHWKFPPLIYFDLLIKLGADVNYSDEFGFNCLYDASQAWHLRLVRFLLENGADPNSYNPDAEESLLSAVTFDYLYASLYETRGSYIFYKIIEILKEYGAK